ncbi:sodium-dependent transporter [Propionispora hippei]|uniref:Neurotransmitter:Na+ symporter, NSS family n=1 Tax=Propionispora hippei DSM 15287 TaxID=1123003 RepID=A0A1M6BX27_9FIRM|nr:sodium-dependent transporter [Propionispora hippei]SHI53310.1 neurotransmitter:Na+ symporter, NSS family [Propionispora hippei DSM 15287]
MLREKFSSGLAVFFATLGSAVGLGNIWKFPYLIGQFGGGAFLLVYLLCIVFVGLPIMLGEFYIGRKMRRNAVGAIAALAPNTAWKHIGTMGVGASYFIMFFYSCVAGWVYFYLFKALCGDFSAITMESAKAQFGATIVNPVTPVIWQGIVLAVVATILAMGVSKGIERITKTLMPLLFILVILCDIRALTLPGAFEGVHFLFDVDFSKLSAVAILTAMGLAFFKLSLGMGTMITYGSYFTNDNNLFATSLKVALSDTLISILAGLAVFPTVFSFGLEPGAGPGLLFMTIPLVFSQMPFGGILLIAFFFLAAIAATTAMLSLVEVPIAYMAEERGVSRPKAALLNAVLIFVIGVLATWSVDKDSLLGYMTFMGRGFFDWFDYLSSNVMLPLGGLLIALFIGYRVDRADVERELSNGGSLAVSGLLSFYFFAVRYVTPALLIIIFLNSVGIIKL